MRIAVAAFILVGAILLLSTLLPSGPSLPGRTAIDPLRVATGLI